LNDFSEKPTAWEPAVEIDLLEIDVRLALESLMESEREVVEMRVAGLSFREIASRLSLPLGKVKQLYKVAIEKLRERLE
jgi:RNA polymerase sigma factor (sigma-70 family)